MTYIKHIRVRPVLLPMAIPHTTASGVITESPLILIDIESSDGVIGRAILFTYTAAALIPLSRFIENIASLYLDKEINPAARYDEVNTKFRLLGTQGMVGMAIAGLDMALWDLKACQHGMSLVSLLGGEVKPIPAYGGIGFDGVKGVVQQAEHWQQLGLHGVKAKIGYPSVQEDIAVVNAVREVVGEEMEIMVDYNQCLTPSEAKLRITLLASEGIFWVEEPTLAHNYIEHQEIASAVNVSIQCGENWWGPQDVKHALDSGYRDLMMFDVMKIGGVTGWQKAASMIEPYGVNLSSHLWPEISASLLCCYSQCHRLEYCDWWNSIINKPLSIENGYAIANSDIGSGITWNESEVARYLVK